MPSLWQVVIADLKSSRQIPARERPAVDRALRKAVARTLRIFGAHFRLVPQLLKGDELQAVLRPEAPALAILTYLRSQLIVGAGRKIDRLSSRGPFESEGEAFHRARAALDLSRQRGSGRLTGWITGQGEFDEVADAVLGLADAFAVRWTLPQWEAVAGRLERKDLHAIARERRVSFQSVSK